MKFDKPMKLLLVEDDTYECEKFEECVRNRSDVELVEITASSKDALHYTKVHQPECIILDLMLDEGYGSGLDYLKNLEHLNLPFRPIIIVISFLQSFLLKTRLNEFKVDFAFCKKQPGYCAELVINTCLEFRGALYSTRRGNIPPTFKSFIPPDERNYSISEKIGYELNLIGINVGYKGYEYLHDAIYLLLYKNKNDASVIKQVAKLAERDYSTVLRTMQSAIKDAWSNTPPEILARNFRNRIVFGAKVPSPSDFVHYYADKIAKIV